MDTAFAGGGRGEGTSAAGEGSISGLTNALPKQQGVQSISQESLAGEGGGAHLLRRGSASEERGGVAMAYKESGRKYAAGKGGGPCNECMSSKSVLTLQVQPMSPCRMCLVCQIAAG